MTAKDPIPAMIVGLGAGVGVGVLVLVITFFLTFTICSDTSTAEKVFPFALIANPSLDNFIALIAAAVQFPIYGLVLGFVWAKANATKLVFVVSVVALLVLHVAAGNFASRRVAKMWQQKFAQAGY
jgi:Na+-transporting NADH:ubiquinone oxidoreductase subunit NqrD